MTTLRERSSFSGLMIDGTPAAVRIGLGICTVIGFVSSAITSSSVSVSTSLQPMSLTKLLAETLTLLEATTGLCRVLTLRFLTCVTITCLAGVARRRGPGSYRTVGCGNPFTTPLEQVMACLNWGVYHAKHTKAYTAPEICTKSF
jgi:hypothetical protein